MAIATAHVPAARAPRGPQVTAERARLKRKAGRRRRLTVLLLLSPWIIGFLVFTLYPICISLYWSFTRYGFGTNAPEWVGLRNYTYLFTQDPNLKQALLNTVFLAAVGLPLRLFAAIFAASLLTRPVRGVGFYRLAFYIPALVPAVASAILFSFLLQPEYGPVNLILKHLGVENPPLWFYDSAWAKPALITISLWGIGDTMLVFLAGLVNVPRSLYEAVEVDGGRWWAKFRHVTLPLISPVTFFVLITGVIGVLQAFDEAYVGTRVAGGPEAPLGAPEGSLLTYPVLQYSVFTHNRIGYASALAWVLFLITMVLTLIVMASRRKWVYAAGSDA